MSAAKPPSLLDPKFRYISAAATDLRKTFERVRKEQRAAERPVSPPAQLRRAKGGSNGLA